MNQYSSMRSLAISKRLSDGNSLYHIEEDSVLKSFSSFVDGIDYLVSELKDEASVVSFGVGIPDPLKDLIRNLGSIYASNRNRGSGLEKYVVNCSGLNYTFLKKEFNNFGPFFQYFSKALSKETLKVKLEHNLDDKRYKNILETLVRRHNNF